jgi:hypothetical protein
MLLRKYIYCGLKIIFFTVLVQLSGVVATAYASPLDNWHWRNPLPQGNHLSGVTFGINSFVAVGDGGTILTSPDGVNWTEKSSGITAALNEVCYAKNFFVAVGEKGTVITSPNGVTWTPRQTGTQGDLSSVIYANNKFIAVGGSYDDSDAITQSPTILTSSDGIHWNSITTDSIGYLQDIAYGNGAFVATGMGETDSIVLTSADGLTWSDTNSEAFSGVVAVGITYGNNTFVAVGSKGTASAILTSPDGAVWSDVSPVASVQLEKVVFANNMFVTTGFNPEVGVNVFSSDDGTTWEPGTIELNGLNELNGVTYAMSKFVTVGEGEAIFNSSNGKDWGDSKNPSVTYQNLLDIVYANDTFVAVGGDDDATGAGGFTAAVALTSADGTTWAQPDTPPGIRGQFRGVTFGKAQFVAVGSKWNDIETKVTSAVFTSPDGTIWTDTGLSPESPNDLQSVAFGNDIFVAVGSNVSSAIISTSPDGTEWTDLSSPPSGTFYSVAFLNNVFVAAGKDIDGNVLVFTSTDGLVWADKSPVGLSGQLHGIAFGNNTFVATGYDDSFNPIILTSIDGETWTPVTSPEIEAGTALTKIIYAGKMFVALGSHATILTSLDAVTWTSRYYWEGADFFPLAGIVFDNNALVTVGMTGSILQSDPLPAAPPDLAITITTTPISDTKTKVLPYKGGKGTLSFRIDNAAEITAAGVTAANLKIYLSTIFSSTNTEWLTVDTNKVSLKTSGSTAYTGSIPYTYKATTSSMERSGKIMVGNQAFDVPQAGAPCTILSVVTNPAKLIPNSGQDVTITVNVPDFCDWQMTKLTVSPAAPSTEWWLFNDGPEISTPDTPNFITGSRTFTVTIVENTVAMPARSLTATFNTADNKKKTAVIKQAAGTPCKISKVTVNQNGMENKLFDGSGGSGEIIVTVPQGCSVYAETKAEWFDAFEAAYNETTRKYIKSVSSPFEENVDDSGIYSQILSFDVPSNAPSKARSAAITVIVGINTEDTEGNPIFKKTGTKGITISQKKLY